MLKNKQFWIGFLVALVVFVGLGELQRSNNRAAAEDELNQAWSTLKNNSEKAAAMMTARTVFAQNKSWFLFSNSSADGGAEEYANYDGGELCNNGSLDCFKGGLNPNVETDWTWELPSSNVESSWVWADPVTGEWQIGGK